MGNRVSSYKESHEVSPNWIWPWLVFSDSLCDNSLSGIEIALYGKSLPIHTPSLVMTIFNPFSHIKAIDDWLGIAIALGVEAYRVLLLAFNVST
jgi:hypothetical protein